MIKLIRKIPPYDTYYTEELTHIKTVMEKRGYDLSMEDANSIWRDYSAMQAAYLIGCGAEFINVYDLDEDSIVDIVLFYGMVKE